MPSSAARGSSVSLAELTAHGDYFRQVGEVIQRVPGACDEGEAVALLKQGSERLGADSAAFASFIRDDPSHESYRFLLACDPVWCCEYERRAWYANDPWLNYALNHSEPARASEIAVGPQHRAVLKLAEEFGVRSAVIVPAPSSGGLTRVGVLCLGSSTAGFFEGDGFIALKVVARSLAMELHEWWIGRIRRDLIANAQLTPDDLILLRHERLGHRTKRIATELALSPSSIDTRFQRVNAKLGVPNRAAAARMAAEYGLI
jgi:DNA-binding CsgD family transcriptional regulator